MTIHDYLQSMYESNNKLRSLLICSAMSKHGTNLSPCLNNTWDSSFKEAKLNGVDILIFWYNTEDTSTHCMSTSISRITFYWR